MQSPAIKTTGSSCVPPPTFNLTFRHLGLMTYQLSASQVLPLVPEEVFIFFQEPRNLSVITPEWLDFRIIDRDKNIRVLEGAEFDYTIKWLGLSLKWRSRIVDYRPPDCFTDIQVHGPYRSWMHLHMFEKGTHGTIATDRVTYKLPLTALLFHRLIIRKQLSDIFCYRAVKVAEWAHRVKNRHSDAA